MTTACHRPSPPRHHPISHIPRRRDPAELLEPITELTNEERVELYGRAWGLLLRTIGAHRTQLECRVDSSFR